MTVEVVKAEAAQAAEHYVAAEAGVVEQKCGKDESLPMAVGRSSSYREESNFLSDLKEHEKKALSELKKKLEEAIAGNTLFTADETMSSEKREECEVKIESGNADITTGEKEPNSECAKTLETEVKTETLPAPDSVPVGVDEDISIWGVPLLPSKGDEKTDVVLLKFLRAREFKINDAFDMLRKTLQWRKEFKIVSILDEEFEPDLAPAAYMSGVDRQGHPICYNIFGVLEKDEVYEKTLASAEKREQFLRWRVQLMERGLQKLEFKPGGVNSLVQINDLKNSPRPSRKEVRAAVNKAVALLQDNYPEFVTKNIFINVPFWHFAFHSLLSPFLTQRTRSKLVLARPSNVTETLLKYIPIQEIPVQYGGIKRDNDYEFSIDDDEPHEITIKTGSTEIIEIPTPECGTTLIWDVIVLGWEVNYSEEFVPASEGSYTKIIQKGKKMGPGEEPVRRTFKNSEPGKILLSVENCCGKKKNKKVFYRYKVRKASC